MILSNTLFSSLIVLQCPFTVFLSLQSLDDGRPERPPQHKPPLRQDTNMANFSYRFSIYNINGQTITALNLTFIVLCSVCLNILMFFLCLQRR